MSEFWVKEWCPECSVINWTCIPSGDCSSRGQDGCKCRKCGHIWYWGDDEDYEFDAEMGGWESIDDCNWEEGKKTSN